MEVALGIATPFPLIPLSAGRWDRAFQVGRHEGLLLPWLLSSSSLCPLPVSLFLPLNQGELQPPFQRAASRAGVLCGGREGKAAAQTLCSLAEHRAEVLCSSAALTFTGMAVHYETAKVRSNSTGLPSLTKNAVGQRQATTLFA